ncbi:MAG: hypothetical protein R3B70_47130 [Polyangiaceae bacterium]
MTLVPGLVSTADLPFPTSSYPAVKSPEAPPQDRGSALPFGQTGANPAVAPPAPPSYPQAPATPPAGPPTFGLAPSAVAVAPVATPAPQSFTEAPARTTSAGIAYTPVSVAIEDDDTADGEPEKETGLAGALAKLSQAPPEEKGAAATRSDTEPPPPDAPETSAEVEAKVDFDSYPPARCGAIAARVASDEEAAEELLKAEELTPAQWEQVHAHWLARIREDAGRSRRKSTVEYDTAYVGALEERRGPIAVEEYARLSDAAERGPVGEVLGELSMPEKAWPHIHRVWLGRMSKDVWLMKQVRATIDTLRAAP